MGTKNVGKLQFIKETIRNLAEVDLRDVNGGIIQTTLLTTIVTLVTTEFTKWSRMCISVPDPCASNDSCRGSCHCDSVTICPPNWQEKHDIATVR